jgi:hypothetical protein
VALMDLHTLHVDVPILVGCLKWAPNFDFRMVMKNLFHNPQSKGCFTLRLSGREDLVQILLERTR